MLDNIMQKSARIEDAYAGNLDGLKQRVEKAGVSNELLAAFVLQGQLAQREAAQRNAAMQQQSNPQTVTQQMQLALDANSSPSEGEVVERTGIAGQQMARNQQMPQGGGGIASQAGPVNLAGGGIVSFDNGSDGKGPVEAEETVSYADIASEFGSDVGDWIVENPVDAALIGVSLIPVVGQVAGLAGRTGLGAYRIGKKGYDMLKANPTAQRLATKVKDLAVGAVTKPKYKPGEFRKGAGQNPRVYDPEKGAAIGGATIGGITAKNLLSDDEEEVEETGIAGQPAPTTTKLGPSVDGVDIPFDVNAGLALPPSMVPRQPNQPGVGVLRDGSLEDLAKPPTAVVPPAAPAIDPDAGIKAALEKSANLDPVAQAKARSAAVKDDLGLAEGIATLGDRKGRRERAYEETTASGMDNLIDLLTAGGRGGITGVGARSGQLRREENARRMAYEDTLDGIEDKTMTLRSTIGGKAATSYDNTMKTMLTVQQNAQTSILNLSASEQKAIRETRANDLAEARNGLMREQVITGTFVDASTIGKYQTAASAALKVAIDSVDAEYATRISRAQSKVDQGKEGAEEALQALRSERAAAYENHPSYAISVANQEQVDKFASQGTDERKVQQERILAADLINKKVGT